MATLTSSPSLASHTAYNPVRFVFTPETGDTSVTLYVRKGIGAIDTSTDTCLEKEFLGQNALAFDLSNIIKGYFTDTQEEINDYCYYDNNLMALYTAGSSASYGRMACRGVAQIGCEHDNFLGSLPSHILTKFKKLKFYEGYPLDLALVGYADTYLSEYTNYLIAPGRTGETVSLQALHSIFSVKIEHGGTLLLAKEAEDFGFLTDDTLAMLTTDEGFILTTAGIDAYRTICENADIAMPVITGCLPNRPVYLRWINTYGGWDYYMFERKHTETKTLGSLSLVEPSLETTSDAKASFLAIDGEAAEQITVAAEDLDADDYEGLSDIYFSPLIQIYENGKWLNVYLEPGSASRDTGEPRQSVGLVINKSPRIMQY